jgi:hypothetical protein
MNVSKNDQNLLFKLPTKKTKEWFLFYLKPNSTEELEFEKTDPTNLNGLEGPKGTYTVTFHNNR